MSMLFVLFALAEYSNDAALAGCRVPICRQSFYHAYIQAPKRNITSHFHMFTRSYLALPGLYVQSPRLAASVLDFALIRTTGLGGVTWPLRAWLSPASGAAPRGWFVWLPELGCRVEFVAVRSRESGQISVKVIEFGRGVRWGLESILFKLCQSQGFLAVLFFQQGGIFEGNLDVDSFEEAIPQREYILFLNLGSALRIGEKLREGVK